MKPEPMTASSSVATLDKYLRALAVALGYRDRVTHLHSERVRGLAGEVGRHCNLDASQLAALRLAALFHDIGKIGVPDSVLLKPGALDQEEFEVIKQHSEIGAIIIASTELEGAQQVALYIRHHHEHFDGGGYPDGLSGHDIPLCSRIISLADSYDAMAVRRVYQQARTHPEIMATIRAESGSKHDPELVDLFIGIIENSPFRTVDRL